MAKLVVFKNGLKSSNKKFEAHYKEFIEGMDCSKKISLIGSLNPEWKDLFEEYFGT